MAYAAAVERVTRRLLQSPVYEAVLARREAGCGVADDLSLLDELAQVVVQEQHESGSWGGSLLRTAEALLLLHEFQSRSMEVTAAVARALHWLAHQQNQVGRFGDPCENDLHQAQVCHHFATGFYAEPLLRERNRSWILASGLELRDPRGFTFAASALALRAVVTWRMPGPADTEHLDVLRRVAHSAFRGGAPRLPVGAVLAGLGALAAAPRTPGGMTAVHGALSRLAGLQRADGSWPGIDIIHVLDLLLFAIVRGYGSPLFDAAICRAADQLVVMLRPDGTWGAAETPARALIGWRALRYASSMAAPTGVIRG